MKNTLAVRDWHWEITKDCNLKCLHCLIGDHSNPKLSTQESVTAISRIVQLGGKNLRITGGEPLMRKDLGQIIQEAHTSGLGLDLITNGTMLHNDFLKKYGRYIKHIAISIDGQKQTHEYIRGKGLYAKSMLAVQKVMAFGINLSVYITVHALNENSINNLVEELISAGVKSFHFSEINMEGRAAGNRHLLLKPKKSADRLRHILSQLSRSIEIGEITSDSNCSISPNSVYLQSDGKIYACVEIALKSPEQMIAHVLEPEAEGKITRFFSEVSKKKSLKCRYSSFSMPGLSILLNEPRKCPFTWRIDNEKSIG